MIKFTFIIILFYWFLINRKDEKARARYNIIIAVLFFLMMGLRNEAIYGDTYGYVKNFWDLQNMSVEDIIFRWPKDTFFYIFTHFLHPLVFHDYTLWLLFIAALYMYPMYLIVKRYSDSFMYSWVCFFFFGLMFFAMAGIRQTMAFGLVMAAFIMLLDGKKRYFFALIVAAFFFHGTSLICLIYYPLSKMKFGSKMLIWYFVAFVVLMTMGAPILQHTIELIGDNDPRYIAYGNNLHGSNYTYMLQQALIIIPSLYILRNRYHEPLVAVFSHMSIVAFLFVSMSPVIAEMFRLSMYFSWADIILFSMAMVEGAKKGSNLSYLYVFLFVVYCVFISKSACREYYFWFEDTSHIIRNFWI